MDNNSRETIAQIIRRERKRLGLSQPAFVGEVGADIGDGAPTVRTVSRWESGESIPDLHWHRRIAHVLELPPGAVKAAVTYSKMQRLAKSLTGQSGIGEKPA